MNVAIDYGNSQIKVGIFEQRVVRESRVLKSEKELIAFLKQRTYDHGIVSTVAGAPERWWPQWRVRGQKIQLTQHTPLPITLPQDMPETVGTDRIAIACGAAARQPRRNCLTVGLGTCLTADFVDAQGVYRGGSISLGLRMRYRALEAFTSQLPLLEPAYASRWMSTHTEEGIHSGTVGGMLAEIDGMIKRYKQKFSHLGVILCGGDSLFFEKKLRHRAEVAPSLVLHGLNTILLYNVGA